MVIIEKISLRVGQLGIPQMESERIKSQTRDMVDVTVDGLAAIASQISERPVGIGERDRVVGAIVRHFLPVVAPAHHSLLIHCHCVALSLLAGSGRFPGYSSCFGYIRRGQNQCQSPSGYKSFHDHL